MSDLLQLHIDQAQVLTDRGEIVSSIPEWRAAVRLAPDNASLHYNLASALQNTGRIAEAVHEHHEALRLDPGFWHSYYALGYLNYNANRWREAIACFQRVLALDPGQINALRTLAAALYYQARATKRGDDWQAAKEAVTEVNRRCPDDLFFRTLAAFVTFRSEDRYQGLKMMEALAEAYPQDSNTLNSLAWMQRKSGQWHAFLKTIDRMTPLLLRRWGWDADGNRLEPPERLS